MLKKNNFNAPFAPYQDYFQEDEHIHTLSFSPGDNVTNKELNLLQTIIQDQISLFGSYFLTPNSVVTGGEYKLASGLLVGFITHTIAGLVIKPGLEFKNIETGKHILVVTNEEEDPKTSIRYFVCNTADQASISNDVFCLYNKETDSIDNTKYIRLEYIEGSSYARNTGYVSFNETIMFIEGVFVYSPAQTKIIPPNIYSGAEYSVGFDVSKSIISFEDDPSLSDNVLSSESFKSPGADRYQILANLTVVPVIKDDDSLDLTTRGSFVEYLRVKNNKIIKDARLPIHSEFEKTLARRTYDTSGSYTVKPFKIKIEDSSPTEFKVRIFPGKAYILGYEIEHLTEHVVILPRLENQNLYRTDKLIIDSTGNFSLIKGIESSTIKVPKDKPDTLTLYRFLFKPGCNTVNSIGVKYVNTRRYTMRDIGKIESRIENIEYYTALSLLEKQTADQKILDQNGNNRFKNGFMVDNFKTYKGVDLSTRDNKFSFDLEKGYLRPCFEMQNLGITFNQESSSAVVLNDQLITLPFEEVLLLEQPNATTVVNVNPYEVFVWEGKITLNPQNIFWVDTETRPALNVEHYGEEDVWKSLGEAGFRYIWGSWDSEILKSNPDSEHKVYSTDIKTEKRLWNPEVDSSVGKELLDKYQIWVSSGFTEGFEQKTPDGYVSGKPAVNLTFTQGGSEVEFTSQIITRDLGTSVKDVALAHYIKGQTVHFSGEGFKPNSTLYAFLGDVEATNWCTMDDVAFGELTTDPGGFIRGNLYIPDKTFTTGSHNFKLTDDRTPTAQLTTTFGIAKLYAKGMTQTKQQTFISTREPELIEPDIDIIPPPPPSPTPIETPAPSSGSPDITPTPTPTPSASPEKIKPLVILPCGVAADGTATFGDGFWDLQEKTGNIRITYSFDIKPATFSIVEYLKSESVITSVAGSTPYYNDNLPLQGELSYIRTRTDTNIWIRVTFGKNPPLPVGRYTLMILCD